MGNSQKAPQEEIATLQLSFYENPDVVFLAKQLLGKMLVTHINGIKTAGIIVETEAYKGPEDKACHAFNMRRTKRTEVMFSQGGVSYVYFCYGMHHLFNIVTGPINTPHAVLIRAVEPVLGIEFMLQRRVKKKLERSLTAGPGALCQALGIDLSLNAAPLNSDSIKVLDHSSIEESDIVSSPRVNIAYAKEHASLPWRFRIKHSKWTSLAK
ncbi:MAG: DNA-3-methyladenine glycosylase [Chlamydiae bacterium CG10_big_fil_rev_8_21_14_0_10_35_9]|nr:MAG: DNA-3-methyladenine glycosylase [Chlamydiae bacterium CG10_big_fil_rev_8_21_14_0_10_35_9]